MSFPRARLHTFFRSRGDLNDDGFSDLFFSDAPNGTLWVFLGGSSGIPNSSLSLAASTIADPGTGVTDFAISLH